MTGALIQLNGNLAGTGQDWWAITFACNFRALGEIALGTVCYEASRRLSQISFSTGKRILFSLLQVAGYGLAFFYACCYTDRRFSGQVLLVLAVAGIGGGAGWYFKIYRPKHQKAAEPEEDYGGELDGYDCGEPYWDEDDDGPPWDEEDDDGEEADK